MKQVKRKKAEKNFKSEPQYTLGTLVKYLLLQASSGFFSLLQSTYPGGTHGGDPCPQENTKHPQGKVQRATAPVLLVLDGINHTFGNRPSHRLPLVLEKKVPVSSISLM